MLDPVSIVGFALQAVQNVNEAEKALRGVTDRYKSGALKDLGKEDLAKVDCRELELQLGVGAAKIVSWQSLWFEETDKSEDFFQTLWGQSGRDHIQRLLKSISSKCDEIQDAVADLAVVAEGLVKKYNVKRPDRWRKWPSFLRLSMKSQIDKAQDKQIRGTVDILGKLIDELWTFSELYFRSLHGVPRGSEDLARAGDVDTLIRHALKSRNMSIALYWHCQSRSIDLDLDMNLLNHDREVDKFPDLFDWSDLKLSYHMFYGSPSSPSSFRELVLDPYTTSQDIREERSENEDQDKNDKEATLDLALIQTQADFEVRVASNEETPEVYFHVTSKATASWQDVEPIAFSLFAERTPETQLQMARSRYSLVEKISLAYRIVECGLFLLGTPWLSHLSSSTLQRLKTSKVDYQYTLHVEGTAKIEQNNVSTEMLERSQIFQIGVLLIEIALESTLSSNEPMDLQVESKIPVVEKSMGIPYKQACEFCLNNTERYPRMAPAEDLASDGDIEASGSSFHMMRQYYSEVFMR